MKGLSILLALIWLCSIGCSQSIEGVDLEFRLFAENILKNKLSKYTNNTDHIIFTSGKEFIIVVIKKNDRIQEFYLHNCDSSDICVYSDSIFTLKGELLAKMFDTSRYRNDFVSFDSEFYDSGYDIAKGNMTYFAFYTKDGKRHGESRLSMFVKPNPIDFEVYQFFVERVMYHSDKKYNSTVPQTNNK